MAKSLLLSSIDRRTQTLSGRLPFSNYNSIYAVIAAIMFRKERPPTLPSHSVIGIPYEPAWEFAQACWSEDPSSRPALGNARNKLVLPQPQFFTLETHRPTPSRESGKPNVDFSPDEISKAQWIGDGGFSDVYKLVKSELGTVALKRLKESGDADTLRERRRVRIFAPCVMQSLTVLTPACQSGSRAMDGSRPFQHSFFPWGT